jgi:hypothetical protein
VSTTNYDAAWWEGGQKSFSSRPLSSSPELGMGCAGRKDPGTKQTFGRDLKAAIPSLRTTRPRDGDDRRATQFYPVRYTIRADALCDVKQYDL